MKPDQSSNSRFEDAVQELRDIEAIKQLKATYCYLVDERRWDELAQLMTVDAEGDYGFGAVFQGRDTIMRSFFHPVPASYFFLHVLHNAVVKVNGDSATGQWYTTVPSAVGNQAVWIMGRYRDEFRRVDGEWRIKSVKMDYYCVAPYEEGWGKQRIDAKLIGKT